jgi:HEAT repeat protein
MQDWAFWIFGGLLGLIGLVLGVWALFWDRSRGRRRCPKCWYDMVSAVADEAGRRTCPECGRAIKRERQLFKTHRRWRWAEAGTLAVIVGIGTGMTPWTRGVDWIPLLPTRVLIFAIDHDIGPQVKIRNELFVGRIADYRLTARQRKWFVPWVIRMLDEGETPDDRTTAVKLLALIGGRDKAVTPTLLDALDDPDPLFREMVINSIGSYLGDADLVLPRLEQIMLDKRDSPFVRSEAALVIGRYEALAACYHSSLLLALQDSEPDVRAGAARSLARIGAPADAVVPLLVAALDDPIVKKHAIIALGAYGYDAAPAVPRLIEIASDRFEPWRFASMTLGQIGPPATDALPVLEFRFAQTGTRENDIFATEMATRAIRGESTSFTAACLTALESSDLRRRYLATETLYQLDALSTKSLLELIKALDDSNQYMVHQTCWILTKNAAHARPALPKLRQLKQLEAEDTQIMASHAINAIERIETTIEE